MASKQTVRELFDRLTLGMVQTLEQRAGVVDIKLYSTKPATFGDLTKWEAVRFTFCSLFSYPHVYSCVLIFYSFILYSWTMIAEQPLGL